ncbi:MAG: glycosyltransferase family 2 protein [Chloroflexi bacterium]|nr:glycosyltransferase family 2 protein [Chloroflexota bacterium]
MVIFARNEEHTIGEVVRAAMPFCGRVLVMDGHSRDLTRERAQAAGATVYRDPGLGKGSAVRAGLSVALGNVIVLMDADGSHAASDIPSLVAPIQRGQADLVVGSRFAGGSDELSLSVPQLIRTLGNISMNIAINKRFGVSLTDTLNGFRAIRKSVGLSLGLRENRHTIEQEMVIQALRRGFRVVNVPAHEYTRRFGQSTIDISTEWPNFVWCLIRNLLQPTRIGAPGSRRR